MRLQVMVLLAVIAIACTSQEEVLEPPRLAVPSCAGDVCTEGVNVDGRFYALMCWGVDPSAVLDDVIATGSGVFAEARPIAGLPRELWLAVTGELPCRPASGGPLEHEWYLLENDQLTVEERREYLPVFRSVTTEP